jgi:hypothetical protein
MCLLKTLPSWIKSKLYPNSPKPPRAFPVSLAGEGRGETKQTMQTLILAASEAAEITETIGCVIVILVSLYFTYNVINR